MKNFRHGFTIIHTADWHMQDSNHDEILRCLEHLVMRSSVILPDLIVIAGDITESRNTRLESKSSKAIVDIVTALGYIAPVAIVSGTPSHDGACSELLNHIDFVGPAGGRRVHVSMKPEMLQLICGEIHSLDIKSEPLNGIDAFISMLPAPTKHYFESYTSIIQTDQDIAQALSGILSGFGVMASQRKPGTPHIHVGHYPISGAYISETQTLTGVDIDIHPDQLLLLSADVICLGHIHKAQELKHKAFYSGGVTRNTYGEMDDKGFYIHTITGSGVTSEFEKLPARALHIIRKDFLERYVDGDEIKNEIVTDLRGAWVKIEITVWADEAKQINQADLESHFHDCGCDKVTVTLIRKPRETIRSERITVAVSLKDKVTEMASLRLETISHGVIEKSVKLETMEPDALVKTLEVA